MAKLTLNPVGNFTSTTVQTINTNSDRIEAAIENTLSRDGSEPNHMLADLDMNNQDILNAKIIGTDALIVDGQLITPVPGSLPAVDIIHGLLSDVVHTNTITTLKALNSEATPVAYLKLAGREGLFKFTSGDFSTEAASDVFEALYVKADAVDVNLGMWVRQFTGPQQISWYGAAADGVTDDGARINSMLDMQKITGIRGVLASGKSYFHTVAIGKHDFDWSLEAEGAQPATLLAAPITPTIQLDCNVPIALTTTMSGNALMRNDTVTVASNTGILPGDIITLRSNKAWYTDPREDSSIGETDATGTAQAGSASTITLKASTVHTAFIGESLTIISGTGAGQARTVTGYVDGTKVATVNRPWLTNPDATSVYLFPFTFKGDTFKVRATSGSTNIFLAEVLMDGYDIIDLEDVTVEVRRPVSPKIRNLIVKRTTSVGADDYNVRFLGTAEATFTNVHAEGSEQAGFSFSTTYKTRLNNCSAANQMDASQGYGASFFGGYNPVINGWHSYNCRRHIDFTGSYPITMGILENFNINCGGVDVSGVRREPNGVSSSTGFGSHGGARHCVYRNGQVLYGSAGFQCRGVAEILQNVKFMGQSETAIRSLYGSGLEIDNCHYSSFNDQGSLFGSSSTIFEDSTTNARLRAANYFIQLWGTRLRGTVSIKNCSAKNLQKAFIGLQWSLSGSTWYDFDVQGNTINFDPNTSVEVALIASTDGSPHVIANGIFDNNEMISRVGPTPVTFGANVTGPISSTHGSSSALMLGGPKVFAVTIPDDSVAFIRSPFGQTTKLRIGLYAADTISYRAEAVIEKASTTLTDFGALSGVAASAAALSGTTGTDAQVNLYFNGSTLQVENRTGAARMFYVTVYPAV